MVKKDVKKQSTNLTFRLVLELGIEISGVTLEEALTKAREMKVTDLLDLSGVDHNDSSIQVTGVSQYIPIS